MSYLDAAMKKLERTIADRFGAAAPFRAIVASIDSATGMVAIQRLDASTPETELRARIGLEPLLAGDEVLCLPVSGAPVIVGKVNRGIQSASRVSVAQVWNTYTPFTTTSTTDYTNGVIGTQIVGLSPGTWSYRLLAEATMWRSVGAGEMYLRMEITDGQSMERNTPVAAADDKDVIRLPFKRDTAFTFTTAGNIGITIKARGATAAGVTYVKQVALSGEFWRVG